MSDTKTPDTKAPGTQAATPTTPGLPKLGDTVRLRQVHGYIQHPFELTEFKAGQEPKVVIDGWHLVQIEAGKLAVVAD